MTVKKTRPAGRPKGPEPIFYDGKWMRLKIPTPLHTNIRIEAFKTEKNLDQKVIEYLHIGYETVHGKQMNTEVNSGR